MKTITVITLLLIAIGWSSVLYGQASSSSDFKIIVEFDPDIPVEHVKASYYKKSGAWFDEIGIEKDTALNQLTISGHNSYITRTAFTTLIFTLSETTLDVVTNDSIHLTTQFFLFTKELESFDEDQIDLKILKFSREKPCVLINGTVRPDKYTIVRSDVSGLLTDSRFDHVFFGNEIVEIDDL